MTYDPFRTAPIEKDTRVLFKHEYTYEGIAIRICTATANEARDHFDLTISSFGFVWRSDLYPPDPECPFLDIIEAVYAYAKERATEKAVKHLKYVRKCGCDSIN